MNESAGPERYFATPIIAISLTVGLPFVQTSPNNDVAISLAPGASEAEVISQLDLLLERYGSLGAYERVDQESHRFLSDEISQDRITGILVPSIFLGVAAFLIHMVLSRLVSTERNQVAVMKAFGYGNVSVSLHYLKFALVAVLAGTAAGTGLGFWWGTELTRIYERFFYFPALKFELGMETVALAIVISAGEAIGPLIHGASTPDAQRPRFLATPSPPQSRTRVGGSRHLRRTRRTRFG